MVRSRGGHLRLQDGGRQLRETLNGGHQDGHSRATAQTKAREQRAGTREAPTEGTAGLEAERTWQARRLNRFRAAANLKVLCEEHLKGRARSR